MDEALLNELLGEGGNNDALIKALRAQQARGRLGQLTGDRVIAPQGTQMLNEANTAIGDIGQARFNKARQAALIANQQRQAAMQEREFGANERQRAFERSLAKAQLGLGYDKLASAEDIARLKASGKGALSPAEQKNQATAKQKLVMINLAKQQLGQVKQAFQGLKGSYSAGPFADKYAYTEKGRNFDKLVDAMRDTVTGLTRTPGIGAMSDFETRLTQSKMPSRGEYEGTTDVQIKAMEDLLNGLEGGYTDLIAPKDTDGPDSEPDADADDVDAIASKYLGGQ